LSWDWKAPRLEYSFLGFYKVFVSDVKEGL
jgi:hypothetical protein